MKAYFKYFAIPFIILGVLAIAVTVLGVVDSADSAATFVDSRNTERLTDERVFDNADLLTDAQEAELEALITKRERETGCDIIIVNLDESLEEYAESREDVWGKVPIEEYVLIYADDFYEEYEFGYDEAGGDGILFLDNRYRESDGWVYTRILTSGRAYDKYGNRDLEQLENAIYDDIDDDPYQAYITYVNGFADFMLDRQSVDTENINFLVILGVSLVIAIIYLIFNWSGKKGKKTTVSTTYVAGGRPRITHSADTFLHKSVTKRRIESSSGGSGGGGRGGSYRSSGGGMRGGSTGRR